jgi:hypothetical protein
VRFSKASTATWKWLNVYYALCLLPKSRAMDLINGVLWCDVSVMARQYEDMNDGPALLNEFPPPNEWTEAKKTIK